jgi:hypothetical protein
MTRSDAISSLRPNSEWTLIGEAELIWSDTKEDKPTEAEIEAELIRLEAEYDAQEYARNRKSDYPDIGDQLDALYHAGVFPANMAARIKETKDKYPK